MKWVIWRITAKNFTEEARFSSKVLADVCAEMLNEAHDSVRFEVTKVGETPIW